MSKRLISGVLSFLLICTQIVVPTTSVKGETLSDATVTASDGTVVPVEVVDENVTATVNDGKFVLYTWERGLETNTATNYGVSVVVENDVVKEVVKGPNTVNDDAHIPVNGYVLYAHEASGLSEDAGSKRAVLMNHFKVGDSVKLEGYSVKTISEKTIVAADTSVVLNVEGVNVTRPAGKYIVYTQEGSRKTTGTGNYGVEVVVQNDKVIDVVNGLSAPNTNNTTIPDNGYVFSAIDPSGSYTLRNSLKNNFKIGDTVRIHGITIPEVEIKVPQVKVLGEDGEVKDTINIDLINPASRPADKVTLYNAEFGAKTGTNQWGVEVVVEKGIVKNVYTKPSGYGGDSNIPLDGFVLSVIDGAGQTLRGKLRSINIGDKIELENITLPEAQAVSVNNKRILISGINTARAEGEITLYNAKYGMTTGTEGGVEVVIENNKVKEINTTGNSNIPLSGYVLSAKDSGDISIESVLQDNFSVDSEVTLEGVQLPESSAAMVGEKRILIDGVNINRGSDTTIIYTPDMGRTTKTGPWGVEVVVENNKVKQIVNGIASSDHKNDSSIPSRGYVISAIDKSGSTTLRNALLSLNIGDEVVLEGVSLNAVKTLSVDIDAIDPSTKEDNPAGFSGDDPYPGFRGANQLIVYTKEYGHETTGTNEYGAEAVIVNGRVVQKTIGNSNIPADGFVISGHGEMRDWINSNVIIGSKAELDKVNKIFTITVDGNVYVEMAETEIEKAENSIADAKAMKLDVPITEAEKLLVEAKNLLAQSTTKLSDGIEQEAITIAKEAQNKAIEAYYNTIESYDVEGRGVWHRPTEKSLEDVIKTLDKFASANLNMVFLETFYHGYTIYPSNIADWRPEFANADFDVLKAFVEEGKKRGIEIHAWVQDFYVGNTLFKTETSSGSPIIDKHPEWAAVHHNGQIPSIKETGYIFMNPALPEVRDFLSDLYEELVTKYEVEGLQLDYIRYPAGSYTNDFSYDDYSINQFKKLYNVNPKEINAKEDPEMWENWCKWRQNNITTFVQRINDEVKNIKPQIQISTAVFPNQNEALYSKMQDWGKWADEGYLDIIAPMAYYSSADYVQKDVEYMVNLNDNRVLNYAGIAPYLKIPPYGLVEQVIASRKANANGVIFFDSKDLYSDTLEALVKGPFRKKAIVPSKDLYLSINTILNKLLEVEGIVVKDDISKLINALDKVKSGESITSGEEIEKLTSDIYNKVEASKIDSKLKTKLLSDLNNVKNLVIFGVKHGELSQIIVDVQGVENNKEYVNTAITIKVNSNLPADKITMTLDGKKYSNEKITKEGKHVFEVIVENGQGEKIKKTINFTIKAVASEDTKEFSEFIKEALENETDRESFNYDVTNNPKLDSNILKAVKDKDKEIDFTIVSNGRKLVWTLNGKDITDENIAMDLSLNKVSPNAAALQEIDSHSQIISFKHHGKLPAKLKVAVPVDQSQIDVTKEVYLYYYNETTKKAEKIDKLQPYKIGDGYYVDAKISHCSDYFLTNSEISVASEDSATSKDSGKSGISTIPKTGSIIDLNVLAFIGIITMLVGVAILKKKNN